MKQTFLSILFCLFCCLSFSQVFPQGNAEWITMYQVHPCMTSIGYHIWKEKLEGDTVIGNYTYQILTFQPLCIIHFQSKTCPAYESHSQLLPKAIGGIRQEGEKVFFYKFSVSDGLFTNYETIMSRLDDNREILLYDFSWSIGDTVRVYTGQIVHLTYRVTNVEFVDGKNNITLQKILPSGATIKVIEGIGETRGIFGMFYYFNFNHDNLYESCFFQDGEPLEYHSHCALCGPVSVHEPVVQQTLDLFPNPTSDEIYIDTKDAGKPLVLRVYNSTGQLLFMDDKFQDTSPVSFRKLELKGWLFITLTTDNGLIQTGKVLVH